MCEDDDADELLDLAMLMLLLQAVSIGLDRIADSLERLLADHLREQRRLNRALPMNKTRVSFSSWVATKTTPKHFRRMFRMPFDAFSVLCNRIESAVGEEVFQPERKLFETSFNEWVVPPIQGEVKVAVSLRMLAGGSYLDLIPMFDVSSYVYVIFRQFLDWVLSTMQFPLVDWLMNRNWEVLEHLALQFAEKSNAIFYGPFASLDGVAIRIHSPRLKEVPDPGNYCCRKGFYALNVQAICDKLKRFLWCYPSNKGSTHDHAAFCGSQSYGLLVSMVEEFKEKGLFIAGDTAYGLTPFLITPCDAAQAKDDVNGAKDSFNFHLSSCRIYIECAFGEMVMRWGILWRTLKFNLVNCNKIIRVCMLLHNFIVDQRQGNDTEDAQFFSSFEVEMDSLQRRLTRQSGEMPTALVTDNNEPRGQGRPTVAEAQMRDMGKEIRLNLTVKLAAHNMSRPMQYDMEYNEYGHIYTKY